MADIKLKPCPFCGCKHIQLGQVMYFDEVYAECKNCGVRIYGSYDESNVVTDEQKRRAAVELWNRRAEPKGDD